MELTFEIGDRFQPKGHALAYFKVLGDEQSILATYLIIPPVKLDLAKYIPPMLAGRIPHLDPGDLAAIAIPPIAEPVGGYDELRELAEAREDDLIYAGVVDASRPDNILLAANEAARLYAKIYSERPQPASKDEMLTVRDVLYSLMSERDKLSEMAKLAGKLRYALEGDDTSLVQETVQEMQALGRLLPEKYKIDQLIDACKIPGEKGNRLAALYIDRCYRLCNEEYVELARIDAQINELRSGS